MTRLVFLLMVLCALLHSQVDANGNCKEEFMKMKKAMNKMMEDGSAPPCADEYNLKDFECTGGEDPEKDKEMHEKFKEHYNSLSKDDQDGMKDCLKEMGQKVLEEVELSDECREEAKKMESKMTGE